MTLAMAATRGPALFHWFGSAIPTRTLSYFKLPMRGEAYSGYQGPG